ncbi:MAG: YdcF family protein [Bacillota bacterium]|nr:YdcF family protein [Bacillota bacterium]
MKKKIIINIIRIICFCLTAFLLYLYVYPISINIGGPANDIGIIMCLIIMTLIAFWSKCKSLYFYIRKNKFGKIAENIIAVILCIAILWGVVGSGLMIYGANVKPAEDATVIVLGCKVDAKHPSVMLQERLDAAVNYLNLHPNAKCVVSGGQGGNEEISEAQCMHDYLISHHIAGVRIYIEDQSKNTDQNLNNSFSIIEKNQLSKNIAIVSDGFHEFRAIYIAKRHGIQNVGSVPSMTPLQFLPEFHMRELLAIINEVFLR